MAIKYYKIILDTLYLKKYATVHGAIWKLQCTITQRNEIY